MFRKIYRKIFLNRVEILKTNLKGCNTVLDLGCGDRSPISCCKIKYSTGVDIFPEYIDISRRKKIHDEYILMNLSEASFNLKSFDAVIALEVLEHMSKEEGVRFLNKIEGWAENKVIISCPNGFVPQGEYEGNPYQKHLSSWTPDEFKAKGYRVVGFNGWKKLRGEKSDIRYKPIFLWERVSDLTQLFVYYFPKHAFQFYAIKRIEK